jgi:hypothetical protein
VSLGAQQQQQQQQQQQGQNKDIYQHQKASRHERIPGGGGGQVSYIQTGQQYHQKHGKRGGH